MASMTLSELETRLRQALAQRSDVRFAILFGSCVSRGPDAAHDVDIAVAFDRVSSLMQRASLAVELEAAVSKAVDVVDIDDASTLLRWEVVRSGKVLAASSAEALLGFQARVPIEYADLRPYLDREAEGLRRALGVR